MPKPSWHRPDAGMFTSRRVLIVTEDPDWAAAFAELLHRAGCLEAVVVTPETVERALADGGWDLTVRLDGSGMPVSVTPAPRRAKATTGYVLDDIIGQSQALLEARRKLTQLAAVDAPVLITGETGTGKELFAQALHTLSHRATAPFVAVNVAAVPETLLESELFGYAPGSFTGAKREGHKGKFLKAHGGTIFLDELGDLPLPLQSKLLRVLQEREVEPVGGDGPQRIDVRVVSATHRPLPDLVREGKFRADLFYRLNVLHLPVPALRERTGDPELLAEHFLDQLARQYGRTPPRLAYGARERIKGYDWPGNVRELRNAMEFAFTFAEGPLVLSEHLPPTVAERPTAPTLDSSSRALERDLIAKTLASVHGNKAEAARRLGISRSGLYLKLHVLGFTS